MFLAPSLEHLGINSASVVANPHAEAILGVFEPEIDVLGPRMTKCIDQGFSANSVKLKLYRGSQLLPAGDIDAKVHIALDRKFLLKLLRSKKHRIWLFFCGKTGSLNHRCARIQRHSLA